MGCFEIVQCTCNHQENPLGLDRTPRFGWKMRSDTRGDAQTAYRITVSTDARRAQAGQGDVWDSGQTAGDGNVSVAYAGPPLQPRTRYYWCVTAWNRAGEAAVSRPAFFETGKLNEAWRARWITAPFLKMDKTDTGAPYLRRTFPLRGEVRSARLYICGLGYHEAFIEGKKVSENLLEPAFTKYDALSYYRVYDVTEHLPAAGPATLGVALGNLINLFNPERIVLNAEDYADCPALPERALEAMKAHVVDGLNRDAPAFVTRFDPADLARSMAGELCDALFSPRFETDVFERIDNMNPDSPQETNAID